MTGPKLMNVYNMPTSANVCNQVLREVITLSNVSMTHVTMAKENVSLLHQHSKMSEVYLILEGSGILYHGDHALLAEAGTYLVIPPNMPHKLNNTGNSELEHFVFAVPPFNPEDVELLDDYFADEAKPEKFIYDKEPITALDGATVYELMNSEERNRLDMALAVGILPKGKKAKFHYHKISEEIYFIASGTGMARVGAENLFYIGKGSVVYVPRGYAHALENSSKKEDLEVLCVSSPSYRKGDFHFV